MKFEEEFPSLSWVHPEDLKEPEQTRYITYRQAKRCLLDKKRVKEAIDKFADEDPLMMFEGLNWSPIIKDYFKKELGL